MLRSNEESGSGSGFVTSNGQFWRFIDVDAINEIRRTPHGISASGDALRRLLRSTVNFSTSASVVEALNFKIESKRFH